MIERSSIRSKLGQLRLRGEPFLPLFSSLSLATNNELAHLNFQTDLVLAHPCQTKQVAKVGQTFNLSEPMQAKRRTICML